MARKEATENKSATKPASEPAKAPETVQAGDIDYGAATTREVHQRSGYTLPDNFYEVPEALEAEKDVSTTKQAREKVKE